MPRAKQSQPVSIEDLPDQDCRIEARDGYSLAASCYQTPGAAPRRVVLINSATAVPRAFYRHFATALTTAGYTALTYDYRGIGESSPPGLRGFQAQATDWVLQDMAGILDWIRASLQPEKLFLVGHSVGGQLAGLLDRSDSIDGMITLSAQSGFWKLQGKGQRLPAAFHVHCTLPLSARLLGYAPWSWFSKAEDLPAGVALQWARWCRDPQYLLGDDTLPLERFSAFKAPILAYSFADDSWGTRRSVDVMMAAYPRVERRHIEPAALGLPHIGHFGAFRSSATAIWQQMIDWLDAN